MYSRLLKPPRDKSFFLFGPRATGKTTWVRTLFPNALYIDLLESELFNSLLANPGRLENLIPKVHGDWIIIDEIQRIPELLNEVHRLIENQHLKFILTGSSARKLRKKGHNLLGGRALTFFMHPLTAEELKDDFKVENLLLFGSLPSIYQEPDKKKYLRGYVTAYLEEEIKQEGLTRNLGAFSRFLEIASYSQGSVLNISEVAREAAIERKVIENYFSILEDLLIGYRIYPFSKRAKRRLITHPKFYFFDVGIYRTIRPTGPLDMPEMIDGVALETLLFQELLAANDYYDLGYKIYYYRTTDGAEVDFVLYGEKGIKAFEVKRAGRINSSMFRGLKKFLKDYPSAKTYFLYGGSRTMREGEIEIIPLKEAIKNLKIILD
ncbi:ATP-binding protein [Candidatus Roizmanbacteria bacterium]|nr:ATP-binding protein [Candidatus Roizmanbacteria bacterium]